MKYSTLFLALGTALLAGANTLNAQIALENFSAFQSPQTLFYGNWSASGDPFAGDVTPVATFSQGAGFYNIANVTNADSSYVERSFASSLNLSGDNLLSLSLRLNSGNTADSVSVILLDNHANSAFATFQASAFNTTSFSTVTLSLTAEPDFAWNAVSAFRISGNDPFARGTVNVSLDSIVATAATSPVPEPSTYGFAGAGLLLFVGFRQLRARRLSNRPI